MFLVPNGLKLVILESPYDQINDPQVKELFIETQALKINGYHGVYPYGVLPVDTYDFVATHHLVCETGQGRLEPIMGYKSITLDKCKTHKLPFPGISVLRSSQAASHEKALQELLDGYQNNASAIDWGSSWTIAPRIRDNIELKKFLKELFIAMHVCHEREIGTKEWVTCGNNRVKTDRLFLDLGYQPLQSNGVALPYFIYTPLIDAEAMMFTCTKFSDSALKLADKFRDFWNTRIVISDSERAAQKKAA